jgi:hypothetical protein
LRFKADAEGTWDVYARVKVTHEDGTQAQYTPHVATLVPGTKAEYDHKIAERKKEIEKILPKECPPDRIYQAQDAALEALQSALSEEASKSLGKEVFDIFVDALLKVVFVAYPVSRIETVLTPLATKLVEELLSGGLDLAKDTLTSSSGGPMSLTEMIDDLRTGFVKSDDELTRYYQGEGLTKLAESEDGVTAAKGIANYYESMTVDRVKDETFGRGLACWTRQMVRSEKSDLDEVFAGENGWLVVNAKFAVDDDENPVSGGTIEVPSMELPGLSETAHKLITKGSYTIGQLARYGMDIKVVNDGDGPSFEIYKYARKAPLLSAGFSIASARVFVNQYAGGSSTNDSVATIFDAIRGRRVKL